MPFTLKENESEARERLRAFWAGSSLGRPALHVIVDRPGFVEPEWPHPGLTMKQLDLLPEWQAWRAEQSLSGTVFLAEAMPGVTLRWGSLLVTVAVLSGGDYDYDEENRTGWIHPRADVLDLPLPRFDPAQPAAVAMESCLRRAAETVGGRGFVTAPVMLDGMTTLSMFRGPGQLCLDLLEHPEAVRRWSDALTSVYLDAYDYYHRILKRLGYGESVTWLSVMAEGTLEAVQCDFAVMLSPDMFARFALPDLRRLTDYFDYSLYHLDGTCQMRFLDLLRSLPRLSGIQWNPEPGAGSPVGWIDALREIRRRRFCLHVGCPSVADAVTITRDLGPDGLFLMLPRFRTLDEAERAIREVQRAC